MFQSNQLNQLKKLDSTRNMNGYSFWKNDMVKRIYRLFYIIIFSIFTYYLVLKCINSHFLPFTSMLDTIFFVSWGLMFPSLFCRRLTKSFVGAILLLLVTSWVVPQQQLIAPVLQSNFWLFCHVFSVLVGYIFILIAFILSMIYLLNNNGFNILSILSYIKYGCLFLGIGIILGANWAEVAWGYIWSWDPKETWALITFITLLLVMLCYKNCHMSQKQLALGVALTAIFLFITWYGVNIFSFDSLHTY